MEFEKNYLSGKGLEVIENKDAIIKSGEEQRDDPSRGIKSNFKGKKADISTKPAFSDRDTAEVTGKEEEEEYPGKGGG